MALALKCGGGFDFTFLVVGLSILLAGIFSCNLEKTLNVTQQILCRTQHNRRRITNGRRVEEG